MAFNIVNIYTKLKNTFLVLHNRIRKDIPYKNRFKEILNKHLSFKPKNNLVIYAVLTLILVSGLALAGQALSGPGDAGNPKSIVKKTKNRGSIPADSSIQVSRGRINRSDLYLMARVIEGEAAGEPFVGKVAVGAVIVNRIESEDFPNNLRQVVYQPLAFEAVMNGHYTRPVTRESLQAADLALRGWDPTGGALYYWNPAKAESKWIWQKPITQKIGRHVFAM